MGVYGFFAFMSKARSEKVSRCALLRRLEAAMLFAIEPKAGGGEMGETGLELEVPRPSRSLSPSS